MPVGVHAVGYGAVGGGVEELPLAIHLNESGRMGASYVELKLSGIAPIGHVAVHALALQSGVVHNGKLIEIVDIALKDADIAESLVAGIDLAVGNAPLAEGIAADENSKGLVFKPLALYLS